MSKDESFRHKIKNLFRTKKNENVADSSEARQTLIVTAENVQDISSESPANHRERKIQELTQLVERQKLEPTAPEALTNAVKDLLASDDTHRRLLALRLIHSIIKGQDEELGMLRDYYFHLILEHKYQQDQRFLLDILVTLTKGGQNLSYIDQQIGDLLVKWLRYYFQDGKRAPFLELLVNVIKYNSAFLDEDKAMDIFQMCCAVCNNTTSEIEIHLCLQVLENIIKYYYIKSPALSPICVTLSRTVLTERFSQSSWKLMKELLGTHLGHSTIFTLTRILQNRANLADPSLLRGVIFFIGISLWGSQRVENLHISATAVLPSFKLALMSNSTKVAYEVSLTVLRLVRKYGKGQPSILWDDVLDILTHLHDLIKRGSVGEEAITAKISNNLHDTLTAMELLQDSCTYSSSPDRLFRFIEMCAASRPESSVTMLLEHRASACRPDDDEWLVNLDNLLSKYYKTETRTSIRLNALTVFDQIVATNKILHEDELLDLMLSTFSGVYADPDLAIRCQAVKMLVEQAKSCTSRKCGDLLALLQKIVNREMRPNLASSGRTSETEQNCQDILEAVKGLVDIFKNKLYEPRASQALLPLEVIVSHIKSHYGPYPFSPTSSQIRKLVLTLFLDLRADSSGKVGLDGQGRGSYVYVSNSYLPEVRTQEDSCVAPIDVKVINFNVLLQIINSCLMKEVDWSILSMVLQMMPKQWQNKRLLLSAEPATIDTICRTLCDMLKFKEKDLRKLYNTPSSKFNKSDFDEQIFPVLTCMSAYHQCLYMTKADLIRCLEFGLLTKCSRICVHALRVCCLEMESIMMKMLSGILSTLSRIVANKKMALPLLMFLSCLVRLPKLYRNFNEAQYKFIFAIALPYTDPSQFQHFAVYLAYHVIIMWFVKCRLMYRKQFVQQIIKGLNTHTKNIREGQLSKHADSNFKSKGTDSERTLFIHLELQETCIDMLSRYTYSNCSSVPKRTPVTDFLLEGGRSQSWFVGNKLITITTSGVGSKATKTGLCSRCSAAVRGDPQPSPTAPTRLEKPGRRRHASAYEHTKSDPIDVPQPFTQDDMIHGQQRFSTISESNSSSGSNGHGSSEDLFNAAAQRSSGGQFTLGECNCWCNGWAEIYIHRPSGDTSWILRIQNKELFNYEEFPLSDISSLFMVSPHRSPLPPSGPPAQPKMIESGSLEEKEYEEQRAQHFNDQLMNSSAKRRISLGAAGDGEEITPFVQSAGDTSHSTVPTTHSTVPTISVTSQFSPVKGREGQRLSTRSVSPVASSAALASSTGHVIGSKGSAFTRQISMGDLEHRAEHIHMAEVDIDEGADMVPMLKKRSKTFSYSSNAGRPRPPLVVKRSSTNAAKDLRAGILPSFVFLQLYQMGIIHLNNIPLSIPDGNEDFSRGLKNLERIAPYETHKVGVVYVGKGQVNNEAAILANQYGSQRYSQFLRKLGSLLALRGDSKDMYTGGLDVDGGTDGKYTYVWHDEVVQMVFHIATMIPTKDSDPRCTNKKLHIGNDFVTIVYNDSGETYTMGTIKGKFNYVNIVIEPLDQVTNAVSVQCKDEIKQILEHVSTKVIGDDHITELVQQISLHSSMASLICERLKNGEFFASNWLERLRHMKRMRDKVPFNKRIADRLHSKSAEKYPTDSDLWVSDFTEYS